ncbi:MAG: glycosyltransferase family 4 protein [Chitinispirillaceae bacterium]|nr:glycosyltransferase family 4 protein [Chitinispirillaceae bacterium]
MKIAWIFPRKERCGIAVYSRDYVAALRRGAEVVCLDPGLYPRDRASFVTQCNSCDLVHIQYEPSYVARGRRDFFSALCRSVCVPIVVSLHEVYESFPDVYPRESIKGTNPVAALRRLLYDRRHPLQTAYRRHAARTFHARRVLVHHQFQRGILVRQGCDENAVAILPYPVVEDPEATGVLSRATGRPLRLAASGFINAHFDYRLLFATLERLSLPWHFTWIGGVRREQDELLLRDIVSEIHKRGWKDRFTITGWVSDIDLRSRLRDTDMVCAFFSARSSSGSIAACLAAQRPVIATPLPLTDELASRNGVLLLVPADPERLADAIADLAGRPDHYAPMLTKVKEYCRENSFHALSQRLIELYREILHGEESDRPL